MTLKDKIIKYYFNDNLNQIEISKKLKINQSTVCRVLKSCGSIYLSEKEKRKEINKIKEAEKKKLWIREKRLAEKVNKSIDKLYEESIMAGLKEQQERHAIAMSRRSKLSDLCIVKRFLGYYSYNEKRGLLEFNEKYGKVPNDLPSEYPVHTEKYDY